MREWRKSETDEIYHWQQFDKVILLVRNPFDAIWSW